MSFLNEMFFYYFQRFDKKTTAFVLIAVAKKFLTLSKAVVDASELKALEVSLEKFDSSEKEAATLALNYISK